MSTEEAIVEALRTQPLAAGRYAIELGDPPLASHTHYVITGTFHGVETEGASYGVATEPRASFEEPLNAVLGPVRWERDTLVTLARSWASLAQRALETLATHPAAPSTSLRAYHFSAQHGLEALIEKSRKLAETKPDALRDLYEKKHQLASFVGVAAEQFERARALIEAEREDGGFSVGRSPRMALEIERFGWHLAHVYAVVTHLEYEPDGAVRDARQQEVVFAEGRHFARPERMLALYQALRDVMPERAYQLECTTEPGELMPCDVVGDLPGVLDLKKPVTREDFAAALRKRWKL